MHRILLTLAFAAIFLLTTSARATNTFDEDLAQIDKALETNPTKALRQSLESCLKQRNHAVLLNKMGHEERARRALQYCFDSLQLSRTYVKRVSAPTQEELQAAANAEYEEALTLTPDVVNGLAIYRDCAACHERGENPKMLIGLAGRLGYNAIDEVLREPPSPMPVYPLSEEQRRALSVYLLSRN